MSLDTVPTEAAILLVQQAFWTALKGKDAAQFERILADDFVAIAAISPGEPPQSRADFIRTLTGFLGDVISVEGEHLRIHAIGDVAVLTGIQVARLVLPNGLQATDMLALTNVFRQIDGEWRLVLVRPVQLTTGNDPSNVN